MHWTANEYMFLLTGVLFLGVVMSTILPRVEMLTMSKLTFTGTGIFFIAAAVMLASYDMVRYPPVTWVLPLVPLVILGVLVRDAIVGRTPALPAGSVFSSSDHHIEAPRRAAFFPPLDAPADSGEGGVGRVRAAAADPGTSAQELADIAFTYPSLRAAVASNPTTPSNLLDWLSAQGDPAVHAAIVARTRIPA